MSPLSNTGCGKLFAGLAFSLFMLADPIASAAVTDIANAPLFTSSSSSVHSNILFILDDSGSMDYDYLPDDAPNSTNYYGYKAAQCNGVAYNKDLVYKPPLAYDGSSYPQASYPKALSNGFDVKSSTTDLSASPDNYYYTYSGSQTKVNYVYSASDTLDKTTTFYKECISKIGVSPGSTMFTVVDITTQSTAQQQNYANWYSYYHTRLLMMKTSVGLAFSDVDTKYRVGFTVINNKSTNPATKHTSSGTKFLDPKEFSSVRDSATPTVPSQKEAFYSNLYITNASPSTPLRGALSLAGQYYAFKANGQKNDPIQYSCQKNFTILSTDGYWNTGSESKSAPKYGPYQLDNTSNVGQQDGTGTARPMFDGTSNTTTTVKTWNTTEVKTMVTDTPVTRTTVNTTKTESITTNSNLSRSSYVLAGPTAFTNTIARCGGGSPCTITVTTSATHPYSTGDLVTISGAAPAVYNGTGPFTITKTGAKTFTYQLPTRPAANTAGGTSSIAGSCPVGQGQLTTTPQTGAGSQTAITTYLTTITETGTSSSSITTTTVIPYTETIININGLNTSDTTVAGASNISSTTPAVTVTYGSPSSVNTTPVNPGTLSINWSNGTPSTTCAATAPTPNPSTAVLVSSAPSATVTGAASAGTPVVSNGTAGTPYAGLPTSPATKGTVTTNTPATVTSGGASDSLADVSMYYYSTDLRTDTLGNCTGALGNSVCDNNLNVSPSARDNANYQHMTTFTLGLGNSGTLKFDTNYLSQTSGDYFDIVQGTKNWPSPGDGKNAVNIDDLWHAAVNGRGQFFSASDPTSLINSLRTALQSIDAITGAASAAATSTLQPVAGNNDIFVAQFTSSDWYGDVLSYKIDPVTGEIATTKTDANGKKVSNATWSAKDVLATTTPSSRTIYFPNSGNLSSFVYGNLTSSLKGNFDNFCTKAGLGGTTKPSQCVTASQANLDLANNGENLVNYLRGDVTYNNDNVYRKRVSVMGDIINASPLFVGQPAFNYTESNYQTFKGVSRNAVIYAAANDGMLHAFDRSTGTEKWAYIPSFVIPNLYKLADTNYASNHVYMVDGSPVSGDIYVNSAWKTILVGGLNSGGRGYYALDITVPESPKLLWEFSETDLGLTFGNPIITKMKDGTWVVMFSSGYNNVSSGDGNGHLYVLNANTGAKILKLNTNINGSPAGSSTAPSGLGKINNYVDSDLDNTTQVVYGGDLVGNVWRFDINSLVKPYLSGLQLAQLKVGSALQPITSKPSLTEVSYNGLKYKVIYVGTGKYLGTSDLANTDKQTIYALKDNWDAVGLGDVRAATNPAMVVQTASTASSATQGNIITGTANAVNWTTGIGWYLDLIGSGERVNINPQIVLNALYVGTNVPNSNTCTVGGTAWLYKLDIATGSALSTSPDSAMAVSLGNILVMGMTNVQLTSKNVATVVTRSDGTLDTVVGAQPNKAGTKRRTSWRTLN